MKKSPVPLLQNGLRADGRAPDQMREVNMAVGVVSNADGSAVVSYGLTTAVAAVYGPREAHPRHLALPGPRHYARPLPHGAFQHQGRA